MSQEESKAVAAIAKTANNAIDRVAELSRFVGRIFGSAIQNIGEIAGQYTEYWKIKNALCLRDKLDEVLRQRGNPPLKELPLRIGLPLLDAAVNEDDEELQKLWANLLASAMMKNENTNVSIVKSYVETLRQLDVVDAELLNALFHVQPTVLAKNNSSMFVDSSGKRDSIEMSIAVHNLERLGLVDVHQSKTDPCEEPIVKILYNCPTNPAFTSFAIFVSLTLFGFHFMRACTDEKLLMTPTGEILPTDHRFQYFWKDESPQ